MLDEAVTTLRAFAKRPGMYVNPVGVATVESFLTGLSAGLACAGLVYDQEVYKAVAASRGWKWRATGIVWHMREKGLSEEAIIQELIAIECEAYSRVARAGA